MQGACREALDSGYFSPGNGRNSRGARPRGFTIDVNRARAAQRLAAAEFCPGQAKRIAKDPEKRSIARDFD